MWTSIGSLFFFTFLKEKSNCGAIEFGKVLLRQFWFGWFYYISKEQIFKERKCRDREVFIIVLHPKHAASKQQNTGWTANNNIIYNNSELNPIFLCHHLQDITLLVPKTPAKTPSKRAGVSPLRTKRKNSGGSDSNKSSLSIIKEKSSSSSVITKVPGSTDSSKSHGIHTC